jgi:autoinducer 2-binding protein LuxP
LKYLPINTAGLAHSAKKVSVVFSCALLVILTAAMVRAASAQNVETTTLDEYWTLEEFERFHPTQKDNADLFSIRVAETAEPLAYNGRRVKIAVIYPGQKVSDYWRRSLLSFEARLGELDLDYEIVSFFSDTASGSGRHTALVTEALGTDPDYLIFTLDVHAHKAIAQRLIARGKPKLILQNITTPVRSWRDRQPFLYVGFDHAIGTRLLIDYYNQRLGHGKPFAILYGPKGYVSRARGNTFLQAYSDPQAFNLKASYYVDYDRERSRAAATRILNEHPDIALVYSCSTDIALGVLAAARSLGKVDSIVTYGWGGGRADLDALAADELDVTVMRMNDDNGVAMAEAIALDQAGRGSEVPVVFSGAFELVTSEDSVERIASLKSKAFRYSK